MSHTKDIRKALRARIPDDVNDNTVRREAWLAGIDVAVDSIVPEQKRARVQRIDNGEGVKHWELVVEGKSEGEYPDERVAQRRAKRFGGALAWGSE